MHIFFAPQFLKVHNFPFPSLLTTLFPHLSALVYVLCSVVESNSSSKQPLQDSRALRRKSSGVIAVRAVVNISIPYGIKWMNSKGKRSY